MQTKKTGNLFKDPPIVGTFKVILKACQFFTLTKE